MDKTNILRRRSLREQVELLAYVRDTVAGLPDDDFARWAYALIPLTEDVLRELQHEEQGAPYRRNASLDPPGGTDLFLVGLNEWWDDHR